jgi:tetratricopeptide (TPR) repeat protein
MGGQALDTFGRLLRHFRKREGLTLHEMGMKVDLSSQMVGAIERGTRYPSSQLRDRLLELFPKDKEEIESRYSAAKLEQEAERTRAVSRSAPSTQLQLQVTGMIKVDRVPEARAAIKRALAGDQEPAQRVWLLDQLAGLEASNGDIEIDLRREAIEIAHESGLHDEERTLRLTLARRLTFRGDYTAAHALLDEGLKRHPDAGALWRRKGIVHWYAHEYADALACLNAAMASGIPLSRIVHSRGQILAEWGNFAAAVDDLTLAMEEATSPANEAYARSTRAYAIAELGDFTLAMSEFTLAEQVTPDNAWLHYFRALCHHKRGNKEQAIEGLHRALEGDIPKLNSAKRAHAIATLKQYGIEVNPSTSP